MYRYMIGCILIFSLLATSHANAKPIALTSKVDIGGDVGFLKVNFNGNLDDINMSGEIVVYKEADTSLVQRIKVEDIFHPPEAPFSFKFIDLNDDSFKDLIFSNSINGSGVYFSDVYLWVPKLKRFVKSDTLSQSGEISKSKQSGCVEVSAKCNGGCWTSETLCFNLKTGKWKRASFNDKCCK